MLETMFHCQNLLEKQVGLSSSEGTPTFIENRIGALFRPFAHSSAVSEGTVPAVGG